MCREFELRTDVEDLPSILKLKTPKNFSSNYKPLNWITKNDLVKNLNSRMPAVIGKGYEKIYSRTKGSKDEKLSY